MRTINIDDFYIIKNGVEYIPSFRFSFKDSKMNIAGYDLLCPYTSEVLGVMDLNKIAVDRLCGEISDEYKMVYKN